MSRLRLALLDASHGSEHAPRNFRREVDADLAEFDVTEGELPETFDFDGAILTGSRASAYWEKPWIEALEAWVETAHERDLPLLGICFGHQLLASVLGGEVGPMERYEIGYRTIEQTAEDPIFEGIDDSFTAFTTHSDAVLELPEAASELADNDRSNHGFRKGSAVGLQFHPEYDVDSATRVTKQKEEDLPPEKLEAVLEGITEDAYRESCPAKLVFENFCSEVRECCSVEPAPAR